jgi:hypothetical protein
MSSTLRKPKIDGRRVPTAAAALAKFPKARCKNCPKFFPKTRPNREFCSQDCKDEFNRHGSAFGPLRERLTKLIEKASKEEAARQFAGVWPAATNLLTTSPEFIRALKAAGFIHRSQLKKTAPSKTTKM